MQSAAVKRELDDTRCSVVVESETSLQSKRRDYESSSSFVDVKTSDENENDHPATSVHLLLSPPYPTLGYDLEEDYSGDMRSDLSSSHHHHHLHPYARFAELRTNETDFFPQTYSFLYLSINVRNSKIHSWFHSFLNPTVDMNLAT